MRIALSGVLALVAAALVAAQGPSSSASATSQSSASSSASASTSGNASITAAPSSNSAPSVVVSQSISVSGSRNITVNVTSTVSVSQSSVEPNKTTAATPAQLTGSWTAFAPGASGASGIAIGPDDSYIAAADRVVLSLGLGAVAAAGGLILMA
ncbi:hypothetical protein Rhopal_005203-T1 [Rhodotorula paludigena]|uniref:Uncharacterized protein n=1 Tax=Rhodotorula paludigena TaxID=86838 RepID=A0AAV5GPT4_9BASI|nr:hypothetical protein Rhopal_005203-T1 [Rhodotorula paludigena]